MSWTRNRGRATARVTALLLAPVLALGLGACSSDNDSVAEQAKSGSNKNYIGGNGTIEQIAPGQRGAPVELSGPTIEGKELDVADLRGRTVVINLWASWCGPCQKEAPELTKVYEATDRTKVAFVGINSRESAASGLAQSKAWGHHWPSISDEGGTAPLQLQGKAAATPSTIVLDTEGRIAAVYLGPIERSTLEGMIEDAQKV